MPVAKVPAVSWANGAQCKPARVIMPYCSASCCATTVSSWFHSVIETTGTVCATSLVPKIVTGNPDKPFKKFCIKVRSCFWIAAKPILFNSLTELFKLKIPKLFNVPASNLSGKKEGWSKELEWLPVPPVISGLTASAPRSLKANPPIPANPYKLLCPVKANTSMAIWVIFIGRKPAVWAASKTVNNPFCLAHWKHSSMGKMATYVTEMPRSFSSKWSGLATAWCSNMVVITWSPGCKIPANARFKEVVALFVNVIWAALGAWKKSANNWRVSKRGSPSLSKGAFLP